MKFLCASQPYFPSVIFDKICCCQYNMISTEILGSVGGGGGMYQNNRQLVLKKMLQRTGACELAASQGHKLEKQDASCDH